MSTKTKKSITMNLRRKKNKQNKTKKPHRCLYQFLHNSKLNPKISNDLMRCKASRYKVKSHEVKLRNLMHAKTTTSLNKLNHQTSNSKETTTKHLACCNVNNLKMFKNTNFVLSGFNLPILCTARFYLSRENKFSQHAHWLLLLHVEMSDFPFILV